MRARETEKPKDHRRHPAQATESFHCRFIVYSIKAEVPLRILCFRFWFCSVLAAVVIDVAKMSRVPDSRLETRFETLLASASPPSRGGVGYRLSRIYNLRLIYSRLPTSFSRYVAALLIVRLIAMLDAGVRRHVSTLDKLQRRMSSSRA